MSHRPLRQDRPQLGRAAAADVGRIQSPRGGAVIDLGAGDESGGTADVNCDSMVDAADLGLLISMWGDVPDPMWGCGAVRLCGE
ncbi:MAG: hypothetical protein U0575_00980 [Phycisphaerales bacterium]|jgi:hypothetical protein